jgi:flagellar hook assembly protein FlgD
VIEGDGYVRFHTNEDSLEFYQGTKIINLDVYNFAMEKVFTGSFDRTDASSGALKWDGRDMQGRLVNNGVYFVKITYPKNQSSKPSPHWVKLIVVK